MGKRENLQALLGLSQNEIATLLNINRGQWSMFDSGKRDLPLAAQQQLAQMLVHMKSSKGAKSIPQLVDQQSKVKKELEARLEKNRYLQALAARKTAALEKKYNRAVKALQLVPFLKDGTKKGAETNMSMAQAIESRALLNVDNASLATLEMARIKQELLQYEEQLLRLALK